MKNKIALVFYALLIVSCATYGDIRLSNISLGMTKQQTIKKLRRKPDNLIGAKRYPNGVVEVLQYTRYGTWDGQIQERYWLYFLNDTLSQWGRPGDWQQEADKVYEYRIRQ